MLDILYLLSNNIRYTKYKDKINANVLTSEDKKIISELDHYFSTFKVDDVDWDQFQGWFCLVKNSSMKPEKLEIFNTIFDKMKTYVTANTYEEIIQTLTKREYATLIADKALLIAEGTSNNIDDLQELLDEYTTKYVSVSKHDSMEDMPSFEDLHTVIASSGVGLNWRLDALNRSLGPLRKGDFLLVGKRPETGGTTLAVSEATFMAGQLPDGKPVLYIANEESELAIRNRIKQAAIGKDTNAILYDLKGAEAAYVAAVGSKSKIQLKHKAGVSVSDIRTWLEIYQPGLIIIDQLWKVTGFHNVAGGEVQRMTMVFAEARRWAQEYAPVIAIHQADGTADNEKWLHYNQLYGSKTGIQGEADAIVMVGATNEAGNEMTRYLNIPKNKLIGGPFTDEALRHGKFEVKIQPEIARFTDK